VHCTRLNKRQRDGLNDEKIICQPPRKLIRKMPGLVPGILRSMALSSEVGTGFA
jgi:hypothetical protein